LSAAAHYQPRGILQQVQQLCAAVTFRENRFYVDSAVQVFRSSGAEWLSY